MTNTPILFNYHAHSMAETAIMIHEYLIDVPEGSAHIEWKKYVSDNGICEGRSRIVDFAAKLESVWNGLTEQQGIDQALLFDCFDLGFIPRVIEWTQNIKCDGVFWWDVDSELIKLFTLEPCDKSK